MIRCEACGHDAPHDSPGKSMDGCVADVMHEDEEGDGIPYFLQCCCDGTSGHVVKVAWVRKKPRRSYWIEFFASYCVLCGATEVERLRVYDRPKPADWSARHHLEEHACMNHFM